MPRLATQALALLAWALVVSAALGQDYPAAAPRAAPWAITGPAADTAAPGSLYTSPSSLAAGPPRVDPHVLQAGHLSPAQDPRPSAQAFRDPAREPSAREPSRPLDASATTLPPRSDPSQAALPPRGSHDSNPGSRGSLGALATTGGALALVLGLFLILAWSMRRASPRGNGLLPAEVVEVLGRAPLAARQQVHLLRCGRKLLLVSVTPAGAETLTEITEPEEVDRLAGLCRAAQPGSSTATFRRLLDQFTRETEPPEAPRAASDGHYGRHEAHAWEADDV